MFRNPRNGWIGIDVGASTLTLAQLSRRQGGVELTASASVERTRDDDPVAALRNDLATVLAVAGELHGKRAAAMLSMSSCQLEPGQVTFPLASEEGVEPCFAMWPTGLESNDPDSGWYTLSANPAEARGVSDELLNLGLSCQTLDGVPFAIARAAGMVTAASPDTSKSAVATIDWGWGSATFCVVIGGYPVYVRTLKDCGLSNAATAVSEELGITIAEASEALKKHPPAAPGMKSGDAVAVELAELVRPAFDRFLTEVNRTLTHLRFHRRQATPNSVCLLGGGAALPGVASWLANEVQLPTKVWRPPGVADERRDWSLLGPAIALSALAWEAR